MLRFPILLAAMALSLVASSGAAQGDPKEDACHARARELSGYRGAAPKLELRQGRTTMRLGGSVALGVSRESGPAVASPPAFAGANAAEQHRRKEEAAGEKAAQAYQGIFDNCMKGH